MPLKCLVKIPEEGLQGLVRMLMGVCDPPVSESDAGLKPTLVRYKAWCAVVKGQQVAKAEGDAAHRSASRVLLGRT